MKKQRWISVILPIIILILWQLAISGDLFTSVLLPPPLEVVKSINSQLVSGQLQTDIGTSLIRVLKGYSIGAVIGLTLGIVMGMSEKYLAFINPTLTAIRQIPIIAFIPLIILWCGIGELSKVVIIVLASFFPIMVNTLSGISQTPEAYLELAKLYQLNSWRNFSNIYIFQALPQIFIGLKLGLSSAWMAVVAAEMMAAASGVGYRINDARALMQPEVVISGIIIIGLLGLVMDGIIQLLSKKVTPWMQVNKK